MYYWLLASGDCDSFSAQFFDYFTQDRTFNIGGLGGGGGGGGYGAPQQSGYGVPKAPQIGRPSYGGGGGANQIRPTNRPSYGNSNILHTGCLLMILRD